MDWEQVKSNWESYAGHMQNRWGRLTEEDLATAQAGRSAFVGCVQSRYQIDKALAERHVDGWLSSFG